MSRAGRTAVTMRGVIIALTAGVGCIDDPIAATVIPDAAITIDADPCITRFAVTTRDFSSRHPDFERFNGSAAFKNLVEDYLGPDRKPVYAHRGRTPVTSGPAEFRHWYNDTAGINMPIPTSISLSQGEPGVWSFNTYAYFPVDERGFGNEGNAHNFHFTTELHARFHYSGGETFTFAGDDDVWIFVNGLLAVDLGGPHSALTRTVRLDAKAEELGIEPGNVYAIDLFHAERHTDQSNFAVTTTIGCFLPPE